MCTGPADIINIYSLSGVVVMPAPFILEMKNITKDFPGVRALSSVDLQVRKGEIHALVGENGAGKSTLIKILSGTYPSGTYQGQILMDGVEIKFRNVHESENAGISVIHQEMSLTKEMTIGENIFMGNEPLKLWLIDWDRLYYDSMKLMKRVKLDIGVQKKIKELGVGQQQLVEMAKALSRKTRILILDEPTASLTESETKNLMDILRELKAEGVTCIYISHRIVEVFNLADRVTVLRDGNAVGTATLSQLTESRIISMMVGRELGELYPKVKHTPGKTVLSVENLSAEDPSREGIMRLKDISFEVREGEILGISGLVGAGRTELAECLFGAFKGKVTGKVRLFDKEIKINNPIDAIKCGLSLLSEDRKRYGLVLNMNVMENITLSALSKMPGIFLNKNEEIKSSNSFVQSLRIKTPSLEVKVRNLSGGNQQKVVLGKWLFTSPRILFLDEPTRGIDVGAKVEIYNIMNELINQGVAVVMISSELPEILGMSDRIIIITKGRIAAELEGEGTTQEQIMYYATGGN